MELPREISDSDLAFMAEYTKWDLTKCRERVLEVWQRSRNSGIHVYRCIAELMFLQTRVARHPSYAAAMNTLKKESTAKWLEVGCAYATDVRKVVVDGWPSEQIWCLDVTEAYFNLGLELFGDQETFNVNRAFGNILDETFFPSTPQHTTQDVLPRNAFAVASVAAVLHVLAREDSEALLKKIFNILLKSGGLLFGSCVGAEEAEGREWWETPDGTKRKRFLWSVETLTQLLKDLGYVDISVKAYERPEKAGLESRAPRVLDGQTAEARALSEKLIYLIFNARKP